MNSQNAFFDEPAPIFLPLAIVNIGEMGAVSVTVDGGELPPPNASEHWNRARFGELLDVLTHGRKRTIRIEVHESDGSTFTDIIHAVRKERTAVEAGHPSSMRRARHRPTHQLFEITGSGFIPGEDITVALVVSSAEGSSDGNARALVDLSQLVDHRSEIMLIGRVSGVIVSERLVS
ncbi:hypothetical protein [Leucobacter sp. W1478]|uniref:hypothetical protein n=1 Tax=Leucobacter sp. W1478 TaxID=3439065 RepID=UPI003F31F25D